MDRLESALDNLALAATNNKTVLEQLTAANLALTGTIATLTATNKKLADKARAGTAGTPRTRGTPGKQLLLDAWPSGQQKAHECYLFQQSSRAQR
jgi:hypothetical protein